MVVLHAWYESFSVAGYIDIWTGDSLTQLSSEDFKYFKDYYGLKNLRLSHTFSYTESSYDDYDNSYVEDWYYD